MRWVFTYEACYWTEAGQNESYPEYRMARQENGLIIFSPPDADGVWVRPVATNQPEEKAA